MQLSGRVTNVTNFGAFVDVGVQQDGLVHVSELADRFVKDPTSIVRVGEVVQVKVLGVDPDTGRISPTMKSGRGRPVRRERGGRRPRRDRQRPPPSRDRTGPADRDAAAPAERPDPKPAEELAPVSAESDQESADAEPEEQIPSDLSEEEYMKRKLEELKKRFG
jgi:uncharacterized protein